MENQDQVARVIGKLPGLPYNQYGAGAFWKRQYSVNRKTGYPIGKKRLDFFEEFLADADGRFYSPRSGLNDQAKEILRILIETRVLDPGGTLNLQKVKLQTGEWVLGLRCGEYVFFRSGQTEVFLFAVHLGDAAYPVNVIPMLPDRWKAFCEWLKYKRWITFA